jgi:hypothetical protein
MARPDPLRVFLSEKTAVDAPSTAPYLPPERETSPTSLDPGERAIASLVALGTAPFARRLATMGAGWALGNVADKGSVSWHNALQLRNAPTLAEARPQVQPSKLMGLFNVSARLRLAHDAADKDAIMEAAKKIPEIQKVVDSFIGKHDLANKGVRLNFQNGLLSGNYYNHATKEVFLKEIGKEKVLHELGHAADFTGSRLGKVRSKVGPGLQRAAYAALPIALIAGDRIKEMMPGTIDDKAISFMQDNAPEIMGATLAATQLYPEAKASILALSHIAKTEGPAAARASFKRLGPAWASYLLGTIPPIVGLALARKYMRQARVEAQEPPEDIEKTSGIIDAARGGAIGIGRFVGDTWDDLKHIGSQIGHQSAEIMGSPGAGRRIAGAAKEVGTSPDFVAGALTTAIPAAMGAMYLYGTESGKHIRARIHPSERDAFITGRHPYELLPTIKTPTPGIRHASESWREQHPLRFAGLVGLGSALAGGILTKLFADLKKVL